MNHNEVLIEYK